LSLVSSLLFLFSTSLSFLLLPTCVCLFFLILVFLPFAHALAREGHSTQHGFPL
jgi:hypothetical protein